jgi:hypothetical protein
MNFMSAFLSRVAFGAAISGLALLPVIAQDQPVQAAGSADQAAAVQTLTPEQLESMVAPIALYSDSLLSQVLVASTYPLELIEAQQWLEQNSTLKGTALVDAAKTQNWDPSIQALVPFQEAIKRLTSDIRWTTDLGNAFLAQQADVMSAVQRLRARAKDSGKLVDTPQQKVAVESQDGQSAIVIQPVDPQVVYVPVYNPGYFWGAPGMYPWPGLYYPGIGVGWGWGLGVNVGFYFGGCCGWGGWGWGPGWFNHSIIVNNNFFHRYNYAEFHGGGAFRGNGVWAHDPAHRGGAPYPGSVASRYQGAANARSAAAARPSAEAARSSLSRANTQSAGTNNHSAFGGSENGSRAREQSDHGHASLGSQRSAPASRGGGGMGGGGGAPRGGGGGGGGRRR